MKPITLAVGLVALVAGCEGLNQPLQLRYGLQNQSAANVPAATQTQWSQAPVGAQAGSVPRPSPAAQAQSAYQAGAYVSAMQTQPLKTVAPGTGAAAMNQNAAGAQGNALAQMAAQSAYPPQTTPAPAQPALQWPGSANLQRAAQAPTPLPARTSPVSRLRIAPLKSTAQSTPRTLDLPAPPLPHGAIPARTGAQGRQIVTAAGVDKSKQETFPSNRVIDSTQVSLNYKVNDLGPSGLGSVQLWWTKDGKQWQKDAKPVRTGPPYVFQADSEGTYGLTLIARSGTGRAKQPPQPGDKPQVWVTIDTTKPTVRLIDVKQGLGSRSNEIAVEWKAEDANLAPRPIAIFYADNAEGPWKPIAAALPNTGSHVWKTSADMPTRFWLRIEAVDQAGHVGVAQSRSVISLDVSEPSISITEVGSGDSK